MLKHPLLYVWLLVIGAFAVAGNLPDRVVAIGPYPGSVDSGNKAQQSTPKGGGVKQEVATADKPHTAEQKAYCKDSKEPKDCIIQLRTAEATERQAKFALLGLWLVLPTIGLTALGLLLLKRTLEANRMAAAEAARAATAASEANQISRELFVATERPWVKVDLSIGGPLTYDANGLNVTILFQVTNVGRSPAVNVKIDPYIYTFSGSPIDPREMQQQHLASLKARPRNNWGFMLFPGDTKIQSHQLAIPAEVVEKVKSFSNFVGPHIGGSVTYRFVFDPTARFTSFSVSVQRRDMPRPASDQQKRSPVAIFFDDGDMPAKDLTLTQGVLSEEYAD